MKYNYFEINTKVFVQLKGQNSTTGSGWLSTDGYHDDYQIL